MDRFLDLNGLAFLFFFYLFVEFVFVVCLSVCFVLFIWAVLSKIN